MNLNFDSIYNLVRIVFEPLTNLLKVITINGTALLVILLTLFMVLLLLRFLLRLDGGGLTGLTHQVNRSSKKQVSRPSKKQVNRSSKKGGD